MYGHVSAKLGVPALPGGALNKAFRLSLLAFFNPELEALYQAYQARSLNVWTWMCSVICIMGWCLTTVQLYGKGEPYRSLLPPLVVPFLGQLLPVLVVLALLTCFPTQYAAHQQAVHLARNACMVLAYHSVRHGPLWLRLVDAATGPARYPRGNPSFSSENMFLSTMWYAAAGFPTGQLFDLLFVVLLLGVNVAGNASTCASPLWPAESVTMSAGPLGVARSLAGALLEAAEPFYNARNRSLMTCPAVLTLWQVVGSWLALLVSGLTEISRRRAFLRTQEAHAWLGPRLVPLAMQWPLGSYKKVMQLLAALFLLTVAHVVALAVLLDVMAE